MTSRVPCANCGSSCPGRSPFCGQYCKALAEYVRTCRRWLRDAARQDDPQYLYALDVRLAFLHNEYLGHGRVYDEAARYLTPAQKAAIRERDGGLCVQCGRPGAEVDHISSSSDDPTNLQLLCLDCHHAKTRQAMVPITDPGEQARIRQLHTELSRRIDCSRPTKVCDNEQTWAKAWRSWPDQPTTATQYQEQATDLCFVELMAAIATAAAAARS